MKSAYIGIDLAIAKTKRLPIVVVTWQGDRLVPADLRAIPFKPPRGMGNAKTLNSDIVKEFVEATANYINSVCNHLQFYPERIAIDAPRTPRPEHLPRRAAEVAMDLAGISCFTTPSQSDFAQIFTKVRHHLSKGGEDVRIPHSNQLWMVVGFELYRRLAEVAPCIEVFPQATVRMLGVGHKHKTKAGAVEAQLAEAANHTGWPTGDANSPTIDDIAFGPAHDCLDAYLSAWVAALETENRVALGNPPDDVIWVPRMGDRTFERPTLKKRKKTRQTKTTSSNTETHRRLCPACGEHEFKRWPFGWDAHAVHKCTALVESSPEERKAEYKERYLKS